MFDEAFGEAWAARFGHAPDFSLEALAPFLTHRSVRQFSDRPVDESTAAALVAAAQSAATSSNLQLWSVVSIQESERRQAISLLCGDQAQIRSAGYFFAFLADHHRLRAAAATVGEDAAGLGYTEFLLMAVIDAALAAERMACAAEALGLGICYIGGLRNDPEGVKALLGLPEGVFGTFGLCVGWPADDVKAEIKPRLAQSAVWFRERYAEADVAEYDARMADFYREQGMRGDATWSLRSGRRVDRDHLTGREILKDWLASQGMGTE